MFDKNQAYKAKEVKEKLKLSERQLTKIVKQKKLSPILIHDNSYRFLGTNLLSFLNEHQKRRGN